MKRTIQLAALCGALALTLLLGGCADPGPGPGPGYPVGVGYAGYGPYNGPYYGGYGYRGYGFQPFRGVGRVFR